MVQKVDDSTVGDIVISHIFSNKNDFEVVFRHPGFDVSCITLAFDLNTSLYNRGGLFIPNHKLCCCWEVYVYCYLVLVCILINFIASKENEDGFDG